MKQFNQCLQDFVMEEVNSNASKILGVGGTKLMCIQRSLQRFYADLGRETH